MAKKQNKSVALPQDKNEVTDTKHGELIKWVNDSDDATLQSRSDAEKARDYYDSKQWKDDEKAKLDSQGQAATVINRIKPKMDGLMGMERANRTTVKTFARTPKHEKGATAATESIKFVLQDNFYAQIRSAAWDNLLIEGTAGIECTAESKKDGVKLKINHIMWDRLIYDPHSRKKDFSDAKFLGQVLWMDYEDALTLYPDAKDVLEATLSSSSTYDDKPRWMDGIRKRVKVVQLYWKEGGTVKYASFTRGGYCKPPKESPFKNEEGEKVWPYEFASTFVDREGNRYGACKQLIDVQDEINKRRSKALHLMSVRQVRGERGAVEDVNKARAELAKPDGYIETTPGMEFEILKTGDMAQAQFNLLSEAKSEIDAVSYNAAAAGKETRQMSGVALRNREAASQTELAPMFDVLKHLDIRVYRRVWCLIKQYWKDEKWIRVTDDEQNLKWVGLNKPMTKGEMALEKAQEQGLPPEALQQLQQQIAQDPSAQEIVDTQNDIVSLDVDIVIADAPDTLTSQIEDFQTLGEMVKSGFPMPPMAVIEASPLNNKDKILKMMKEQPQMSPEHQKQMEEMQQQMQQLQQEAQKLAQENQQLKSGQQEAVMKQQAAAQESQMKINQKREESQLDLQLKKEVQAEEIQLERERAMANLSLEREKIIGQLELKKMEIGMNSDGEVDKAISKVQNLISTHESKIQNMFDMHSAKQESSEESKEDSGQVDMTSMMQMHQDMMNSIGEIVNKLNQKKTISLIKKDGQLAGATVQ